MVVRVAGTILEKVDNPVFFLYFSFPLHAFLRLSLRKKIPKEKTPDRRLIWPSINVGAEKIDFRDVRLTRILGEQHTDYSFQTWTFGQEGDEKHKLILTVSGISSNSKKQFMVADNKDCIVKVFDSNGKFLHSLFCPGADGSTSVCGICDIATDQNDNVYVLVTLEKKATELVRGVCMFAKDNSLCHWFALRAGFRGYVLTVEESSSRLCVLGAYWSPE